MARIPLFPLNKVLFPGTVMPLHIFEERYKMLLDASLANDKTFGVSLIHSVTGVDENTVPYPIGTTARIVDWVKLLDGQIKVDSVGERRFRIVEYVDTDQPFLTGIVEYLDDEPGDAGVLSSFMSEIPDSFADYLTLVILLSDLALPIGLFQLPSDPIELSYYVASNLQIDMSEKQNLLEETSIVSRLQQETRLLRRETDFLQRLISLQGVYNDHNLQLERPVLEESDMADLVRLWKDESGEE